MGAQIVAYVLAGIAVVEAVALVVFWRRCTRQQRELDELHRRVDTRNMLFSGGREAVKQVWQTANILRKDGLGAAVRSSIEDLADWAEVERPDLARRSTCESATGRGSGCSAATTSWSAGTSSNTPVTW